MPIIKSSSFKVHFPFKSAHLHTIYPNLFRRHKVVFSRERFLTPDDDFFDIDWIKNDSESLLILLHGLEGSSNAQYIKGMAKAGVKEDFDIAVLNFRGCSGTPNKTLRTYHSGETEDLGLLVSHILDKSSYKRIHLVGFSLGANVVLKYIGEQSENMDHRVKSAVAISVPCELGDCSLEIAKAKNWIYCQHFLIHLKRKVKLKRHITKGIIDYKKVMKTFNFRDFDELYTAPIHGFESAEDYWYKSSANRNLDKIRIPTLILNALDDTFLPDSSYPFEIARSSPHIYLETPKFGGHVGFSSLPINGTNWAEFRTTEFLNAH